MSDQWWSIEVLDGPFSAEVWYDAHGSALIEAAVTHRAVDWFMHRHSWGIVFEVEFRDEDSWLRFRGLPGVGAALDAVPDPVSGLLIYRGRGGSAGAGAWPRPRPTLGAGAAPLPEAEEPLLVARPAEPFTDNLDPTDVPIVAQPTGSVLAPHR